MQAEVDCAQIVKDIRKEFPEIVWVSASLDGCRLIVNVKENDGFLDNRLDDQESEMRKGEDLIAQKDAVIKSIITRNGTPLVHEGDSVKKGDILVKGSVAVVDDAGTTVAFQYVKADADILGETRLNYYDELSLQSKMKEYDNKQDKKFYYLKIGDLIIKTGSKSDKGKTLQEECMNWNRQIRLGENIYLPIYYGECVQKRYLFKEKIYKEEEIRSILSSNFSMFCDELAKKGVQITGNNVKILIDENQAAAKGSLSLVEPLGELVDSEIPDLERNFLDESVRSNY